MNKYIRATLCLIVFIITISLNLYTVNAATLTQMQQNAKSFLSAGQQNAGSIDISNVTKEFTDIGKILTTIGAGVMVAVVTYMGIKYLTSGPEAQAKLKTQLIGVAVSAAVIFGAYFIWYITVKVASTF